MGMRASCGLTISRPQKCGVTKPQSCGITLGELRNHLIPLQHLRSNSSTTGSSSPDRPPRLLDAVRAAIRVRHYSHRTEKAYVDWIRRFILYHGKRHPREMGGPEVAQFLSHLASERHCRRPPSLRRWQPSCFSINACLMQLYPGSTMWYAPTGRSVCRSCFVKTKHDSSSTTCPASTG